MIRFEIKPEVVEWVVQEWVREPEMAQELIEGLMGMMIAYGCISVNDDGRLKQASPALLALLTEPINNHRPDFASDIEEIARYLSDESGTLAADLRAKAKAIRAAVAEARGSDTPPSGQQG